MIRGVVAGAAVLSVPLSLFWIGLIVAGSVAADWRMYAEAGRRVFEGGLYEVTDQYAWPYSPVLAVLMGPLTSVGFVAWRWAQIAAVMALPTWRLRILCAISLPFWFDLQHAAFMTFSFLAAAWALRGNRAAQVAYIALCLFVPRPLYLPVLAWLMWHDPWTRRPFAMLLVLNVVAVVATGWGPEWVAAMPSSSLDLNSYLNFGPSRLIGVAWIPIGVALSAWLTWRGHLGLASLSIAPYLSPYYFMFGLLELVTPAIAPQLARASPMNSRQPGAS